MKTRKSILIGAILLTCLCCNKKASSVGQCTEKPSDGRMCTAIYQPVCGCNNKTYGNSCEAEARGIMKYTEGECKKTVPDS
ncbi:Kazal-type serine protease inhibitor family protein [Emticicia fontis]